MELLAHGAYKSRDVLNEPEVNTRCLATQQLYLTGTRIRQPPPPPPPLFNFFLSRYKYIFNSLVCPSHPKHNATILDYVSLPPILYHLDWRDKWLSVISVIRTSHILPRHCVSFSITSATLLCKHCPSGCLRQNKWARQIDMQTVHFYSYQASAITRTISNRCDFSGAAPKAARGGLLIICSASFKEACAQLRGQ